MRFLQLLISIVMLGWLPMAAQQQGKVTIDDKTMDSRSVVYDGIDVSSYQKDIDWRTTASDKNIKFVYVKATEGATHRQRHYAYNMENARKHGIKVGAYHFMRTTVPVKRQFENFISVVKLEDQDLVPLIDIETKGSWTAKQLADSVLYFAQLLEKHYGCKPMIYTGSSFYNSYLAGRIKGYKLFIARYSKLEPKLSDATWTLWQFSERGRIAGIDTHVDLCRFNRGMGLADILIPGRRNSGSKKTDKAGQVPPPPKKATPTEKKPVPESKQQRKAREKAEKEAKKAAEEKAKQEAKERERQAKKAEKLRQEQQRKAEKERQEKAKRDVAARKQREKQQRDSARHAEQIRQQQQHLEELKAKKAAEKAKEQERLEAEWRQQQEQQAKEAKEAEKKNAAKAKAKRRQQQRNATKAKEQERQKAAKAKSQKTSANQQRQNQGKSVNQSSVDNDDE